MNTANTISVQELRRDPLGFIDKLKRGDTITVIYHSRPYATVQSVQSTEQKREPTAESFLAAAAKARKSGSGKVHPTRSFKEMYYEDMAKKYGLS